MNKNLTPEQLARYFDHTLLKPYATEKDFIDFCAECKKYEFAMAAINPAPVKLCKNLLKESPVHVGAAVGFPLGQNTIESKIFETDNAIQNGADEIDYVINITQLKKKAFDYIEEEMDSIIRICREQQVLSKVIFETCYLTDVEKKNLCRIAMEIKPDFIKTSTGFGSGGATIYDIELMKSCVGDEIGIKASGGIRTLEFVLELIDLGVSRIGASASAEIIETYKRLL